MGTLFTWGVPGTPDYIETPVEQIPSVNQEKLALQGFRHKLGNECSARVNAWKKTEDGKTASDEQTADYARACRAEMLDKILNGQLGVRAAGAPRVTGVDAIRRAVTVESLKSFLKKHSLKMPTGDETVKVAGKDFTREGLIEAMYRKDKANIDAETARRAELESGEVDLEDFAAE